MFQTITYGSLRRRNSTLVRDRFGRPRFSYDPRKAPVGIRDMLTPEELAALERYSSDFNELVNDGDPRTSLRRGAIFRKEPGCTGRHGKALRAT